MFRWCPSKLPGPKQVIKACEVLQQSDGYLLNHIATLCEVEALKPSDDDVVSHPASPSVVRLRYLRKCDQKTTRTSELALSLHNCWSSQQALRVGRHRIWKCPTEQCVACRLPVLTFAHAIRCRLLQHADASMCTLSNGCRRNM